MKNEIISMRLHVNFQRGSENKKDPACSLRALRSIPVQQYMHAVDLSWYHVQVL
eukprot:COSAG05_NODE_958_length_6426_cov_7.214003_6_plen_54_part_00